MNRIRPSKRETFILRDSKEKAPRTRYNLITYYFDFKIRRYRMENPDRYKPSVQFPFDKLALVRIFSVTTFVN